jgi:hypothetical protein
MKKLSIIICFFLTTFALKAQKNGDSIKFQGKYYRYTMKDAGRLISKSGKINKEVLITVSVATPVIILTAGFIAMPIVGVIVTVVEGVIIIVEEFRAANCLIEAGNLMSKAPQ